MEQFTEKMKAAALGNLASYQAQTILPPPTLASAEGRFCELNGQLSELIARAEAISETIGGPRPVGGAASEPEKMPAGVVNRLHDCASTGIARVAHLNDLLASISRALG